jgi:hypothetical protein
VHSPQLCDGHRCGDLPGSEVGVTNLNVWPKHGASSVRGLSDFIYVVKEPYACIHFDCLRGRCLCGMNRVGAIGKRIRFRCAREGSSVQAE